MSWRIASVQGSAPKMPTFSELERASRVQALALHLLDDHLHVAWRDHDDVGAEVGDQLHLLVGIAAAHRHHRAAQPLGAVVGPQAAGEQAVAVGHVHDVAGAAAAGADRPGHQIGPGVDVGLGVADHGRLPVVPELACTRTTCSRGTANMANG
jgi:hypothetical protein